jgi:hypothetical protein
MRSSSAAQMRLPRLVTWMSESQPKTTELRPMFGAWVYPYFRAQWSLSRGSLPGAVRTEKYIGAPASARHVRERLAALPLDGSHPLERFTAAPYFSVRTLPRPDYQPVPVPRQTIRSPTYGSAWHFPYDAGSWEIGVEPSQKIWPSPSESLTQP